MSRRVRVNAGQRGIALPNGKVLSGGEETILTDTQWILINGTPVASLVTDLGATTSPAETPPSATVTQAALDSALAAVASSYAPLNSVRQGRGVVCISWDDGWAEQATIAALADARGQRHTFYLNGSFIGQSGRLSMTQVQGLAAKGHEIGWHSNTHVDMTSLTPAQRLVEWDASGLETALGRPVTAYAYPFGFRNAITDIEAYLRYGSLAALTAGLTGPSYYRLDEPMPFVHYRYDWGASADTLATVSDLVRLASRQPVAVHIYAHRPDVAANPSTAQITALMDLIQTLGVPALPVSDVFGTPGLGRVVNPGFEAGLNGWVPQVGGAGTAAVVPDTPLSGLPGTKSLQLTVPAGTDFAYVRQYVPVIPGRTYLLAGRVRSVGGCNILMRLGLRDINGSVTGTNSGTAYTAVGWGVATATLAASTLSRFAVIDCLAQTVAGSAFVDRVDFGETALGSYA